MKMSFVKIINIILFGSLCALIIALLWIKSSDIKGGLAEEYNENSRAASANFDVPYTSIQNNVFVFTDLMSRLSSTEGFSMPKIISSGDMVEVEVEYKGRLDSLDSRLKNLIQGIPQMVIHEVDNSYRTDGSRTIVRFRINNIQ